MFSDDCHRDRRWAEAADVWQRIQDVSPEEGRAIIAETLIAAWMPKIHKVAVAMAAQTWRQLDFSADLNQTGKIDTIARHLDPRWLTIELR